MVEMRHGQERSFMEDIKEDVTGRCHRMLRIMSAECDSITRVWEVAAVV